MQQIMNDAEQRRNKVYDNIGNVMMSPGLKSDKKFIVTRSKGNDPRVVQDRRYVQSARTMKVLDRSSQEKPVATVPDPNLWSGQYTTNLMIVSGSFGQVGGGGIA